MTGLGTSLGSGHWWSPATLTQPLCSAGVVLPRGRSQWSSPSEPDSGTPHTTQSGLWPGACPWDPRGGQTSPSKATKQKQQEFEPSEPLGVPRKLSLCPLYVGFASCKRKRRRFPCEALRGSVCPAGEPGEAQSLVSLDSLFRPHRGTGGYGEGVLPILPQSL